MQIITLAFVYAMHEHLWFVLYDALNSLADMFNKH